MLTVKETINCYFYEKIIKLLKKKFKQPKFHDVMGGVYRIQ